MMRKIINNDYIHLMPNFIFEKYTEFILNSVNCIVKIIII
jgi:hypothetical protein